MATSKIKKGFDIKAITRDITLPANASSAGYKDHAQVPAGYEFLCWVESISDGWVGDVYPSAPSSPITNFWITGATRSTDSNIKAVFLCIKN